MINDELLSKFDRIQDLPVSEEILGAYAEGNLTDSEQLLISAIADSSSEISTLLCEVEDLNVEEMASDFHRYNQIDFIMDAEQEMPDIDNYILSDNYKLSSVEIGTIGSGIIDSFNNCTLESLKSSDTPAVANDNLFIDSDSSLHDCDSLSSNSGAQGDDDFESEESVFNNLEF